MKVEKIAKISLIMFFLGAFVGCSQIEDSNTPDLGNISFNNSGSPDAQEAFLTGVKGLHNFQFDVARLAFEDATIIDPTFAMAYWGQAMSNNFPLWARQNLNEGREFLSRFAPTFEGRLALAETEKEKAYMTAIEGLFFSSEDKLERDIAYSNAMEKMHIKWPDDHEISIFYALSLLGTIRPGDDGYKRQALAASIVMPIHAENKSHPGAAHFTIHSLDDPDHAILALPAAKAYAEIAPSSAHALHMPSHIFLQLGMWERVVNSNIESYASAVSHTNTLMANNVTNLANSAVGREDFHALQWLHYGNLMLGHYDRAEENLNMALKAVEMNPGNNFAHYGYLNILARHAIETADCSRVELDSSDSTEGQHSALIAAAGMCAAIERDMQTVSAAIDRLEGLRMKAESSGRAYNALQIQILEKEVEAMMKLAAGEYDDAANLAKEASDIELNNMSTPSGPPMPMKPASELYGEILAAAGRFDEAVIAYKRSLNWVPNRTPSIVGLIAAASGSEDLILAEEMRAKIKSTPGINLEQFSAFLDNSVANNIN